MAPQTRSQKPGTSTSEGKKVAARGAKRKEAEVEVGKAESSARGARQSDRKPAVKAAGAASASKGKQAAPKGKSKAKSKGTPMASFPYELDWKRIDARKHPFLYRPGRGEQGVFAVQPYKAELLPLWAFKDPATATRSSQDLEAAFERYLDAEDFVGADMCRKFIQMGFTRARRYANHAGGRKYVVPGGKEQLPRGAEDPVKAEAASIFSEVLARVKADERYTRLLQEFSERWADHTVPAPDELEGLGLLEPKPDADSGGDDHDDDGASDD
ncbi:hypothetical protein FA09DRAFT_319676 [Tilletiopsis washingtonensis]|uniref:Uncharacterized protein n=1 Tax=Tilletiopsis washingtonensis TaxID=58919 RepID=A0A316Z7W3_9BASI|nr:hypothetical protein FA09DRAFT_319676 [Tilletiopsis washingtonensis]PWN97346.1 hypothetical protein FA09DRAFT_319676 [Tilletiopsis washingtonensis]